MDPIIFKLSKPLSAHGEMVDALTFNEPTGNDLIAASAPPFTVEISDDGKPTPHYNTKAVSVLMSRMANVPPSSIKQLSAADFLSAMYAITEFFLPPLPTKLSPAIANMRASGGAE